MSNEELSLTPLNGRMVTMQYNYTKMQYASKQMISFVFFFNRL